MRCIPLLRKANGFVIKHPKIKQQIVYPCCFILAIDLTQDQQTVFIRVKEYPMQIAIRVNIGLAFRRRARQN